MMPLKKLKAVTVYKPTGTQSTYRINEVVNGGVKIDEIKTSNKFVRLMSEGKEIVVFYNMPYEVFYELREVKK